MTSSGTQESFHQIAKPGSSNLAFVIPMNTRANLSPATQDYNQYMSIQQTQSYGNGLNFHQQNFANSLSEGSQRFVYSTTGTNSTTESSRPIEFGSYKETGSAIPYSQQRSSYVIDEPQNRSIRREEQSFSSQGSTFANNFNQFNQRGRTSTIEHEKVLIGMKEGQPTVVELRQGQATLVDVIEKESKIINEKVTLGEVRIVNERELKRERVSQTREIKKENITTDVIKEKKTIELVKEVGIPTEKYIDVVYDVIVDVPIERTIEKEVITEVVVEKPIEKIIEIVVEQEIEVPVEKIIEVPIEMKREVRVPVEKYVHVPYEVVKENIQYREHIIDVDEADLHRYNKIDQVLPTEVDYSYRERIVERPIYIDNIIEKDQVQKRSVQIEVPKYHTVVKNVPIEILRPVPQEKIVYQDIEVPVVNEVIVEKEILVEKPVFRENIIEKPVEVLRFVEKEVPVPVEILVEKPVIVENTIEKKVDKIVEVPAPKEVLNEILRDEFHQRTLNVERVNERPVEKVLYKPVVKTQQVTVPLNIDVSRFVSQVVPVEISKQVNRFIENPVEQIKEVPNFVERIVEKPVIVERTFQIPVETVTENVKTIEKIVERQVIIDKDVIKHVEQIVVKDVPVPVERIVEVEIEVKVERPVIKETLVEEEVLIEGIYEEYDDNYELHEDFEHEDEEIALEIDAREVELNSQVRQNNSLKNEYLQLQRELTMIHDNASAFEHSENTLLRSRLADLQNRIRLTEEYRANLHRRIAQSSGHKTIEFRRDPKASALIAKLKSLVGENNALADQVARTGEVLRKTVDESQQKSIQVFKENQGVYSSSYKPGQYLTGSRDFTEKVTRSRFSNENDQSAYHRESQKMGNSDLGSSLEPHHFQKITYY